MDNNGPPLITTQNLNLLGNELQSHQSERDPLLALILDEMNIKANTRFVTSENKVFGYVDFGDDDVFDTEIQ